MMPCAETVLIYHSNNSRAKRRVAPAVYSSQFLIPTHVAEVVPGVFPLAELAIQPVQVGAEQLELLAAVKTELVRRWGDIVAASAIDNASLRKAGKFLSVRRYGGEVRPRQKTVCSCVS